jgi:hypothetical protein
MGPRCNVGGYTQFIIAMILCVISAIFFFLVKGAFKWGMGISLLVNIFSLYFTTVFLLDYLKECS